MNIPGSNRPSKCQYCQSMSFGKGCPYAPQKVHVHMDIGGQRCLFCGSLSLGKGCPYSPFKTHMRGIDFNQSIKESLLSSTITGFFISKLLAESTKVEDKNILDIYIDRIKGYIGEDKLALINIEPLVSFLKEESSKEKIFDKDIYEQEVKTKFKIKAIIDELKYIISEAKMANLDNHFIENTIIESILDNKNEEEG